MLRRDIKNLRDDVARDLTDMEEDVEMLSSAFDSMFGDILQRMHDDDCTHDVEEV